MTASYAEHPPRVRRRLISSASDAHVKTGELIPLLQFFPCQEFPPAQGIAGHILVSLLTKNGDEMPLENYGKEGNPSSFRNSLCLAVAVLMVFSMSTNVWFVAAKSISSSPTAVLM